MKETRRKKKMCSRCLKNKWVSKDAAKSDYYKDKTAKDGYRFDCKKCHNDGKALSLMRRAIIMGGL